MGWPGREENIAYGEEQHLFDKKIGGRREVIFYLAQRNSHLSRLSLTVKKKKKKFTTMRRMRGPCEGRVECVKTKVWRGWVEEYYDATPTIACISFFNSSM